MKKEKQEQLAHDSHVSNDYTSYGSGPPTSPYRSTGGAVYTGTHNSYEHSMARPHRGGYGRGRGGHSAYHPYQRPPHAFAPQKFRNKSVTFNKQDLASDTFESEATAALTTDSTHVGQHNTEPQTLCPAFTMTGTERDDELGPISPLQASNFDQVYAVDMDAVTSTIRTSRQCASAGSLKASV
jgi:hypothetical protein